MIGQSRWGGCKGTSTVVSLWCSHTWRGVGPGRGCQPGCSVCCNSCRVAPSESPESPVGPTGTEQNGTERNGTERMRNLDTNLPARRAERRPNRARSDRTPPAHPVIVFVTAHLVCFTPWKRSGSESLAWESRAVLAGRISIVGTARTTQTPRACLSHHDSTFVTCCSARPSICGSRSHPGLTSRPALAHGVLVLSLHRCL